jgi:hypothetical protein
MFEVAQIIGVHSYGQLNSWHFDHHIKGIPFLAYTDVSYLHPVNLRID